MKQYSFKSFAILAAVLLVACQPESNDTFMGKAGDPVAFVFSVQETSEVRTRADEPDADDNGLDSVYIASDPYNMNFFIQLCYNDSKGEIKTYRIPSGQEGRLDPTGEALKWEDHTSPHTFYAWNIPWDKNYQPSDTEEDRGLTVEFHNSSEADGFNEHHNNAILEYFVGAKSVPHSYAEHGKYVDLTFHHLVSKIKIGSFRLIETSGAIQEHLQADVTFIGMPTAAKFYYHPEDGGRPRIDKDTWTQDDDSGITYFIDNNPNTEDIFYICPEVDFSQIDFQVKINSKDYQHKETFYGTFADVKFERRNGWAYDNPGNGEHPADEKILHAGEMMTLNITLIPGVGPGLSIIIDKWSTEDPKNAPYHTYPGIYSDAEVMNVLDTFLGQKNGEGGTTAEDIERLFEMYGVTKDGKKYFPLYDNVTITGNNRSIFPIPEGYILDGMGHTISIPTNKGVFGQNPYYNIGPARDVYLTDPNGNNTIYIDAEGYVWITDENEPGGYKQTNNKLEPLVAPNKSYDIDSVTGEVKLSTFYNWNITS